MLVHICPLQQLRPASAIVFVFPAFQKDLHFSKSRHSTIDIFRGDRGWESWDSLGEMADSSTADSSKQHIEGAEGIPENGTSDTAEVGESGAERTEAESETAAAAGDNDIGLGREAHAHEAIFKPRVGSFSADVDVAGAVALESLHTPPSSLAPFDSEKVGVELGAMSLSDFGVSREFKGASIYPEVGKSNLTPSNFQASITL